MSDDLILITPETFVRIRTVLLEARSAALSAVNTAMVQAYWMAGRETVEVELRGKERAAYCARSAPLFAALAVRCVRPRRSAAPAPDTD